MRQRVLLVAGEMDLRARFARELHLSGYAVELACDENRALRLAAAGNLQVAIVAPGPSPTIPARISSRENKTRPSFQMSCRVRVPVPK